METSEFEYLLLKDKCNSVVAGLVKHNPLIPSKEIAHQCLYGSAEDLRFNYVFTAPDYLSVIDYLAGEH